MLVNRAEGRRLEKGEISSRWNARAVHKRDVAKGRRLMDKSEVT